MLDAISKYFGNTKLTPQQVADGLSEALTDIENFLEVLKDEHGVEL